MNRRAAWVLSTALATGALVLAPRPADAIVDAGYVYEVLGPNSAFILQRGETTLPLAVGTRLQAGDTLSLVQTHCQQEECRLVLDLGSTGQRQQLDTHNSRFTVPDVNDPPRLPRNLMDQLVHWFRDLNQIDRQAVDLSSKYQTQEMALAMPILQQESLLVAGKRHFYLRWEGGKAPYRLRLKANANDQVVLDIADLDRPRVADVEVELAPDRYRLELTDALGAQVGGDLRVLTVEASNSPLVDLSESDLPEALRDTLVAAWIVEQERYAWFLEADQLLFPHIETYRPARQVATDLWESAVR